MEISIRLSDDDIDRLATAIGREIAGIVQPIGQPVRETPVKNSVAYGTIRKGLMTTEEIKKEFGVSNPAIVSYRKKGLLNHIRFGPRNYYKRTELEAIFNGNHK